MLLETTLLKFKKKNGSVVEGASRFPPTIIEKSNLSVFITVKTKPGTHTITFQEKVDFLRMQLAKTVRKLLGKTK